VKKFYRTFKEFKTFLNESINISKTQGFNYFKLIQKRIKARSMSIDDYTNGFIVRYDTGLSLLVQNNSVVAYNNDGSGQFVSIPKQIKSFKDLELNIKFLSKMGGTPKPPESFKRETGIEISSGEEDLSKFGIKELQDGLTLEQIRKNFPWLLKAKIKDAIVGIDRRNKNLICWYDGTWLSGTWELGIWKDGIWEGGEWLYGFWYKGTWKGGIWKDGYWQGGTWEGGIWKNGTWERGTWERGTWERGTWEDGTWKGGIWKGGEWETGYWYGGTWKGGFGKPFKVPKNSQK